MKKQAEKDKITALYERLSHDDERAEGVKRRQINRCQLHSYLLNFYIVRGRNELVISAPLLLHRLCKRL